MTDRRASESERAYWKKLEAASRAEESELPPPQSLDEVFDRMEAIRARLGPLASAGLPADDDAAIAENLRIRERFLRKKAHGA